MDRQKPRNEKRLKEILRAYLNGELHEADKEKIERWLDQEKTTKEHLQQIDEHVGDEVFSQILMRIVQEDQRSNTVKVFSIKRSLRYSAIAAAAILLMGSGFFLYQKKQSLSSDMEKENIFVKLDSIVTQPGQRLKVVLPDSSTIYLHGNSKIRYVAQLNNEPERLIYLDQGEAFFEVTHRPKQPFIVQTQRTKNRVLGTSFNIQLRGDDQLYHLSVNTGAVEFTATDNENLKKIVEKGNHLAFNASTEEIAFEAIRPEDFSSWKDNVLSFSNNNWLQIKQKLENWFGVEIHVSNALVNKQYFTATFEQPSLKKVLKGLQQINTFHYTIDGKEVHID